LLIVTGVFTGFIWTSMVFAYVEGYRLHRRYLYHPAPWPRLALHGVRGARVDVLAPGYARGTRPAKGGVIPKDRPTGIPHPRPVGPTVPV
ncbi:MAG: hypothetical protein L3J81_05790, partial [Thermoplasmata archaeon]|nr:hypothetical protein [Thermoplasmata archaeon]